MPITKDNKGRITCTFGTADILIAPARIALDAKDTFVLLGEIEPNPELIDVERPEFFGKHMENWMVKLIFNNPKSIDAFIHVLQAFKEQSKEPT
jgi:hypothetical protein